MPAPIMPIPASLWAMAVLITGRMPLPATRVMSMAVGLGDFFNQSRFVHLIRDLVNNDGFTAGFGICFHFGAGTDVNLAATGAVRFFNTTTTVDEDRKSVV